MKKNKILQILLTALIVISGINLYSETYEITMVEEEKSFWDKILSNTSITNKNLLYASYIAYKDRLNELSIETFNECIQTNDQNDLIKAVSLYYIAKNYFLIGRYSEAMTKFNEVSVINLTEFSNLKFAIQINKGLTHYKLNNIEQFRESLQNVIKSDMEGTYSKKAQLILSSVK